MGRLVDSWQRFLVRFLVRFLASPIVVVQFFLALAMVGCFTRAESDTFWQLRAGLDIWTTGHVPLDNHYSYTAVGRFWPNHEWLWEAALYAAHATGGMPLATGLSAVLSCATFALAFRMTEGRLEWRLGLLGAAVLLSALPWSLRPHIFTNLALMVTLWLVTSSRGRDHARWRLWLLPGLFLVWVNAHALAVLGLIIPISAFAVHAWARDRAGALRFGLVTLLCAAATLVNPLGTGLYRYIAEGTTLSAVESIDEWRTVLSLTPRSVAFLLVAVPLAGMTCVAWRRLRREDRIIVLVALAFALLGARAIRNIKSFAVIAAPALSRLLVVLAPAVARVTEVPRDARTGAHLRSLTALTAIAALTVAVAWGRPLGFLEWTPISAPAATAVRTCPGNLYNHYNLGGILTWFVPEKPVFVDGRHDPFPPEFLRRAIALEHDDAVRRAAFAEYHVRCVAVAPESPLPARLRQEGWRERHRDARWVVLADR